MRSTKSMLTRTRELSRRVARSKFRISRIEEASRTVTARGSKRAKTPPCGEDVPTRIVSGLLLPSPKSWISATGSTSPMGPGSEADSKPSIWILKSFSSNASMAAALPGAESGLTICQPEASRFSSISPAGRLILIRSTRSGASLAGIRSRKSCGGLRIRFTKSSGMR